MAGYLIKTGKRDKMHNESMTIYDYS